MERPNRAGVQNWANRTCKGCQDKFYAREAFLEHCRMVHRMGLWMESGQCIGRPSTEKAPTDNRPDNQRKEAKWAGPPGLQRNNINSPRADPDDLNKLFLVDLRSIFI